MQLKINQTLQEAITAHQGGKLEEAEVLYREVLKAQPTNEIINNNLGLLLYDLSRPDESIAFYKKAIETNPDLVEAHYNLGNTLKKLKRHTEAEKSYKKVIELKPDHQLAHNNLGITIHELGRLDEAETRFKKAIELNPNSELTHNNLGNILKDLDRIDEAESSYKKAIEIKSDYIEAHDNLEILLRQKILLSKIEQAKESKNITEISFIKKVRAKLFKSDLTLTSNLLISNRKVEAELISQLYKMNFKKLYFVDPGYLRYGNGRSSNYKLFENNFSIIKTVEKDLIHIMKETVKSDIFITESFFNIFQKGSGIVPHNHTNNFDSINGLLDQKFSLTYYLDIGDQNCTEPGILKFQDPDQEILPSEGMIVIFPANRKHSATYGGQKDRVMIGVNFYSLI